MMDKVPQQTEQGHNILGPEQRGQGFFGIFGNNQDPLLGFDGDRGIQAGVAIG